MAREMACRKCKFVTIGKVCPNCKSSDLTPDWNGVVLVVEPTNSQICRILLCAQMELLLRYSSVNLPDTGNYIFLA